MNTGRPSDEAVRAFAARYGSTPDAIRASGVPLGDVTPLGAIGPPPGTFGGDFARQLLIALGVSLSLWWLIERKKKPALDRFVVVSDSTFGRMRAEADGGDVLEVEGEEAGDEIEAEAEEDE
jgi:hypothetical protein